MFVFNVVRFVGVSLDRRRRGSLSHGYDFANHTRYARRRLLG